jgi:hypothetical protein
MYIIYIFLFVTVLVPQKSVIRYFVSSFLISNRLELSERYAGAYRVANFICVMHEI